MSSIAVENDSGVVPNREVSVEQFEAYPIVTLQQLESQAEDIVNVGQRYVRNVDDLGTQSWVKFQMCKELGQHKILGSVSSFVEFGNSEVFRHPVPRELHAEQLPDGYRTYFAAAKRVLQLCRSVG